MADKPIRVGVVSNVSKRIEGVTHCSRCGSPFQRVILNGPAKGKGFWCPGCDVTH